MCNTGYRNLETISIHSWYSNYNKKQREYYKKFESTEWNDKECDENEQIKRTYPMSVPYVRREYK